MKRVLITGANSYVGTNVERWLMREPEKYHVDTLDMIDGSWREKDFSGYDVVFHVAGIVHTKETKDNKSLFFKINRDLAIEVAEVSKTAGVSQFIFLSSMSVYGMDTGVITRETIPKPKNSYGKSKLEGEEGIRSIESNKFFVVILRPPMIYGKGCKGNFQDLVSIVSRFSIFPKVDNQRSMIYISNFCEILKIIIDEEKSGLFHPQNTFYLNTSHLAQVIAESMNKRLFLSKIIGVITILLFPILPRLRKAFGSLFYSFFDFEYDKYNLVESIKESL